MLQQFLTWLGGLSLFLATTAASGFMLFKFVGTKWLDSRFAEKLESFKHAQQLEMERLRYRVNSLLDRAVKLNQREFDVLPELWVKLTTGHAVVAAFTSPFQSYADVSKLNSGRLEEFLSQLSLSEMDKEEIRHSSDKNDTYQKAIFWSRLNESQSKMRDVTVELMRSKIFLEPELSKQIEEHVDLLWRALEEARFNEQHDVCGTGSRDKQEALRENGEDSLKSIGSAIQSRLWTARHESLAGG